MKKIIIIFTLFVFLGCSENNETNNTNPKLQSKLIGTWVNEGYYDDVATDENPDGFYPIPNGISTTYTNETFNSTLFGNPHDSGTYTISNDSLLSQNNELIGKIYSIDNSKLIITIPSGYGAIRYGKINDN
ncbi:hypothetical protein [Flavobacterium sp.]|uniref:hypothetical protein n=1 Tax=Flavobacterium sp. TaxID=239 RepID=UPI003750F78D